MVDQVPAAVIGEAAGKSICQPHRAIRGPEQKPASLVSALRRNAAATDR